MAASRKRRKVLVICHGNKWRSPMAAAALAASGAAEVKSAGFRKAGDRAAKRVRLLASVLGHDLEEHRSALVAPDLLAWADVVVYMDGGNRKRLEDAMRAAGIVKPYACLGAWCDPPRDRIPDPAFVSNRHAFVALMCAIDLAGTALGLAFMGAKGKLPGKFRVPEVT